VLRNVSFIVSNETPIHSRAMQKFLKTTKPDRDYSQLCPLAHSPTVSDKIAFKILELVGLSPIVSDFKEGTIEKYDATSQQIVIRLDAAFIPPPQPLTDSENGDEYDGYDDSVVYEEVSDQVEATFAELMEVKLLERDGKEVSKNFFSLAAAPIPAPILVPSLSSSTSIPALPPPATNPSSTTPSPNKKSQEKRKRAGLSGLLVTLQKEAQTKDTSDAP